MRLGFSLVVNTCCLEDGNVLSSGGRRHSERAWTINNLILPWADRQPLVKEVVIVGSFQDGEGYTYIPSPSQNFDCTDALRQRQAGFEETSQPYVIFQHDDHILDETFNNQWRAQIKGAHVYSPARYTRARNWLGERLNNGEDDGYISGHCAIYDREVIEDCPWGEVPEVFTWDVEHTGQIKDAGYCVQWTETIKCYDVEFGAEPWT